MRKLLLLAVLLLCACAAMQAQSTLGDTNVEATTAGVANYMYASPSVTPASNSNVTNCPVYTIAGGGLVNCAVFDSDGTSSKPKTLLCQGPTAGTSSVATGWATVPISGCSLTGGHTYYIVIASNTANLFKRSGAGSGYLASQTCCNLATYAFSSTSTGTFSAYLNLSAGAVSIPTATYGAGTYTNAVSEILTSTSGATICYTLDGSTPTANGAGVCTAGTTYSGAFNVTTTSGTGTVKAIGSKSGMSDSAVATFTYTFVAGTPTFSPVAGVLNASGSITLASATSSPTIYYTTDGSTPTTSSAVYSTPIPISSAGMIKAYATKANYTDSATTSAAYTFATGAPSPSPTFGNYSTNQTVTLTSATPGAAISYCTSVTPNCTPNLPYSSALTIPVDTYLCAVAVGTYGTSASTCGAYLHPVDASADVLVASDDFTAYYDSRKTSYNESSSVTFQLFLDLYSTNSAWRAVGNSNMSTFSTGSRIETTSVNPACFGSYPCPVSRTKEGYFSDHASAVSIDPAYNSGGPAVRCATDGTANCTFLWVISGTAQLVSVQNGVVNLPTSAYSTGAVTDIELRVQGCTFTTSVGGVTKGTTTISGCYLGGQPGLVGVTYNWRGYNVGGNSPSYTPPTQVYQTYTDPLNTNPPNSNPAWRRFATKTGDNVEHWNNSFIAVSLNGGTVAGLPRNVNAQIEFQQAFGTNQWAAVDIWRQPWETFNWLLELQNLPIVPGLGNGLCAANNNVANCYDTNSYYFGINYGMLQTCPPKDPSVCTPFLYMDKVTPWSVSPDGDKQGANQVQTIQTSQFTYVAGDRFLARYDHGYMELLCKKSSTPRPSWSSAMGATANTTFIEAAGKIWLAKTSGNASSTQPSWPSSPSWTVTPTPGGTTVSDGGITWMYYGNSCPTSTSYTRILYAWDGDLLDPTIIPPNYTSPLGNGFPGLFAGCAYSSTDCAFFSNFQAGTVGVAGDPCLTGQCSVDGVKNVPSWLIP